MNTTQFLENVFQQQQVATINAFCEFVQSRPNEDLLALKEEFLASKLEIDVTQILPKPKKAAAPKKPKNDAGQCECRVWGEKHDGTEQCSFKAVRNGLCTRHANAADVCSVPCTLDEDGKHSGLWMGRITDFQEGEPGIPPYKTKEGRVCIEWDAPFNEHINSQIAAGNCFRAKKGRAPRKIAQAALNLEKAMETTALPTVRNDIEIVQPVVIEPKVIVSTELRSSSSSSATFNLASAVSAFPTSVLCSPSGSEASASSLPLASARPSSSRRERSRSGSVRNISRCRSGTMRFPRHRT